MSLRSHFGSSSFKLASLWRLLPLTTLLNFGAMAPELKARASDASAASDGSLPGAHDESRSKAVDAAPAVAKASAASAPPSAALKSMALLYNKNATLADLFGDLDGMQLWSAIRETYQVGPRIDIPFFIDDTDEPNIVTHSLNKRNQKMKERRFAGSIIRRGLAQSARGDPVMVYNKDRKPPHGAITFGSLTNAFFLAKSWRPLHPNVLDAVKRGLEAVVMLHEDMPPVIIRWVINFFNSFFDGAEASFLDKMKEANEVQDRWRLYKDQKKMTVSSMGGQTKYSAAYKTWLLDNHKQAFAFWNHYEIAKSMYNELVAAGIWESFVEFCEAHVDFLEPSLSPPWGVLASMKDLFLIVKGYEKQCEDDKILYQALLLESLRFCLPVCGPGDFDPGAGADQAGTGAGGASAADRVDVSHLTWVFKKDMGPVNKAGDLMQWLNFDMTHSKAVRKGLAEYAKREQQNADKATASIAAAAAAVEEEANGPKGDAKVCKVQPTNNPKRQRPTSDAVEEFQLAIVINGKTLPRTWLTDYICAVRFEYRQFNHSMVDAMVKKRVLSLVTRQAYQFCWTTELALTIKTLSVWYDVRKEIKVRGGLFYYQVSRFNLSQALAARAGQP